MKHTITSALAIVALLCTSVSVYAQQFDRSVRFGGQFFFSYERIFNEQDLTNEFTIQRGYITFRKNLSDITEIRFTQDVSIDSEGDGKGNIELRLKYALLKLEGNDWGVFTNPNMEIGVVHRPWVDFEQKINTYRAQESMFLDQNGIVSSADYGITFASLLGGEMDAEYREKVQSAYPGRFGSLSFGLYNGGGYDELEENNNKLFETRLTLRPMPDKIPGLQSSFIASIGKGNIEESPDFRLWSNALSYESEHFDTMLQGFVGTGDASGNFIDNAFNPIDLKGWGFFVEITPFDFPVAFTNRIEEIVNRETNRWVNRQGIAGVAFLFPNQSKIIVDVRRNWFKTPGGRTSVTRLELITEIRF